MLKSSTKLIILGRSVLFLRRYYHRKRKIAQKKKKQIAPRKKKENVNKFTHKFSFISTN